MTVFRRSVASYHGADVWFAITAYLSIVVLPLVFTDALASVFSDEVSDVLAYIAMGWLLILFIIITPFRLWIEDQKTIENLNELARTKLVFLPISNNGKFLTIENHANTKENRNERWVIGRIGVRNGSASKTLLRCETVIERLIDANGMITEVDRNILLDAGHSPTADVNPGRTAYFAVFSIGVGNALTDPDREAKISFGQFVGESKFLQMPAGKYSVTVTSAANNTPFVTASFDLEVSAKGVVKWAGADISA